MLFSCAVFLVALTTSVRALAFSDAPTVAVAQINLKGVIGYVRFETLNDTATKINTNFTGLPQNGNMGVNWHVHRFPVDLTINPDYRCLNDYVGGHYDPLMVGSSFNPNYSMDCSSDNQTACEIGDLTGKFEQLKNGMFQYIDNTGLLQLGGLRGIVGRTIVVHDVDGANFVCGTIRSTIENQEGTKVVTLSATFISPVAGVVYLRQAGQEHAVMFGKMFWVDGTDTTEYHNWHIHQNSPSTDYRIGGCDDVGPHFDPFAQGPSGDPMYFCSPEPSNITNCEVGDLTGKHDTIDVGANPLPFQVEAFFYTDIFLNLTGVNAVAGRSIAIHAPNRGSPIIACAPLVITESRVVATNFADEYFKAEQASPYEETTISTSVTFPSHNINILTEVLSTYGLCPVRSPYDPLGQSDTNMPSTPDTFPIGSIYQKYSTELQLSTFTVTELPLFGINIVTSRTLQAVGTNRRACGGILPPINTSTTSVAVASFNEVIEGNVLFIQDVLSDGTLGQTNIIVDLHYINSDESPTSGHNWHIHTEPPVSNQPCQGNIGPHFNPFNVSLDSENQISNYSEDCSPYSKLRCESGDLSGKHGQLSIDPPGDDMATFSYLDPNLHLYGPDAHIIIGRSVGIHQNIPNGPLLYCSKVQRAYLNRVNITISEPDNFNRVDFVNEISERAGVSAQSILVTQVDVGATSVDETICVNITLEVIGFTDLESRSNAFFVQCALFRKYRNDRCVTNRDDFIVLCGGSFTAFSDAPTVAVAQINLKGVIGYVRFETLNDTATKINTNFTGLPQNGGMGVNWHVHRFPVDLTINPDYRCLNDYVGGHYDPLMVGSSFNPNYSMDCSSDSPTACEIGDLTGKFEELKNGMFQYIDNTGLLQLGGFRGIVGRTIVVHDVDGANFVCGTIRSTIENQEGTKVVTLSATFISPVAGVVYLRQAGQEHAVMFGKMFWVDGTDTTQYHNWHIHQNSPSTDYRIGGCDDVGPHFDPFAQGPSGDPMYFCSPEPSNIINCEVGDLTGKHDTIDVGANPLPFQVEAFFYTDIFLNLTGVNAVAGRSIAIHAPNRGSPIIACAPLVITESRVVATNFADEYFKAEQASPYEETTISTSVTFPSRNINILTEVLSTYGLCPVRSPYDPLGQSDTNMPSTSDTFPIGSIYQKYSTELQLSTFTVTELPLFGINIVTSRTLQAVGTNRRACGGILPPINTSTTLVAVASFNELIEGNVLFIQDVLSNGTLGQTNIIVDLHYINSDESPTSGHNWHIHTEPPVSNQPCQGNIGPHFNPFNVSLDSENQISNYSEDCSPYSKLRCESGDLSGKHGQLSIDPPGDDMATFSYLDPNLHLYGPDAHIIIGRSVGIHQNIPNGPLRYCSKVQRAYLNRANVTISEPDNFNRVDFVNEISERAGVSAQSILVTQVDVGATSVDETICVNITLEVIGFTDTESRENATIVQSDLCNNYRNDRCMTNRDDYRALCGGSINTVSILLFVILMSIVFFTISV